MTEMDNFSEPLVEFDLSAELWREYDFDGRIYRIDCPVRLYLGGVTHRVLTVDDIIHCVPAPGYNGCVLRWKNHSDALPSLDASDYI